MPVYKTNVFKRTLLILLTLAHGSIAASPFTAWQESPNDPIYTPYVSSSLFAKDDYFPCVIFNPNKFDGNGAAFLYKMWHQSPDGLALSYSNDGVNWTLVGTVITDPNAYHASVLYDVGGFGSTPYHYKMWYWTGSAGSVPPALPIQFAQSVDGVTWTTPVPATQDTTSYLTNTNAPGQPFYQFYGFGQTFYNQAATSIPGQPLSFPYVAYFDASPAEQAPQNTQEAVGLAYSSDGINWIRFGTEPVLLPIGSTTVWDGKYAYKAAIIKLDGVFHMFYSGSSEINNPNSSFAYTFGIGHATSTDGVTWTTDPDNPIFTILDPGEEWRNGRTLAPSVVVGQDSTNCNGDRTVLLQMWFSGGTNNGGNFLTISIGYATLTLTWRCDKMWLKRKKIFTSKPCRRCEK